MNALPVLSRAAVFQAPGEPLTLQLFPIPELEGSEVLVRILCTTVCGSDLHTYYARRQSPAPSVLGHEIVGEIAATGPAGASDYHGEAVSAGDRVTWSIVWSCGQCFFCQLGLAPKCERLMKYGHERITPGRALIGGLAEYCHLREGTAIFKVPENVPDLVASPANCATATVAAVFRHAGQCAGQAVVVHGAGMLGLTACAMAVAADASKVIVLEPEEPRRKLALQFGASAVLDSTRPQEEIRECVLGLTQGRGADIGVELSGSPTAIETGIQLLRNGGRFVMAGATFPARPVQLLAEQLVRRMLHVIGVYNYQPEDLNCALSFLAQWQERFPFQALIGKVFPLRDVNEAFCYAERERPPRVAVIPEASPGRNIDDPDLSSLASASG